MALAPPNRTQVAIAYGVRSMIISAGPIYVRTRSSRRVRWSIQWVTVCPLDVVSTFHVGIDAAPMVMVSSATTRTGVCHGPAVGAHVLLYQEEAFRDY